LHFLLLISLCRVDSFLKTSIGYKNVDMKELFLICVLCFYIYMVYKYHTFLVSYIYLFKYMTGFKIYSMRHYNGGSQSEYVSCFCREIGFP